jgi:CubicO group peptidase (beta-lactamase class C family)
MGANFTIARRGFLKGTATAMTVASFSGLSTPVIAGQRGDVRNVIGRFAAANAFNGIVLLGVRGAMTYSRAFGFADIETQRRARIDDAYCIASISKWLTTIAVLRMVERGRLNLDVPITRWLPEYRKDTGARLTLRHLLWNSSGLIEQYSPQAKADPTLLTLNMSASEAVGRFASADLYFNPGAKFDYIFANWIIVYAIIEAVTGQPFVQAMHTLVIDPLGLTHTDVAATLAGSTELVPSYVTVAPIVRRSYDRPPFLAAAGGYVSTGRDLLQAAHRVFDEGFLSKDSLQTFLSKRTEVDEYALGGRVKSLPLGDKARTIAWETGNTAGYRSVCAHRLDVRQSVVILNNTSLSQRVLDEFAAAIFSRL